MLILTRNPGQSIIIGDNIKITILETEFFRIGHVRKSVIKLGIEAPGLRIVREEILDRNDKYHERDSTHEIRKHQHDDFLRRINYKSKID